jgi:hypothetical protein
MESLNELINLAQFILDNGFDPQNFMTWKEAAFICLLGLLGPLHFYTRSFGRVTGRTDEKGLLAGEGLLIAAREEIVGAATSSTAPSSGTVSPSSHEFLAWFSRPKKWIPLRFLQAGTATTPEIQD